MGNSSPRILKTLIVAADVIGVVVREDGVTVTGLAEKCDLSKSTAYRYLKTLEELDFVRNTDEGYRLSYQLLLLGEHARYNSQMYRVGRTEVEKLASELDCYSHLVTEVGGHGVSLCQGRGSDVANFDYQTTKLQQRDPLHVTASGKAILANLPRDRIETIIDTHGLEQRTSNTITDQTELLQELEEIRDRGFAYNDEEEVEGFRAVGAPVINQRGSVLGSVSVSGPTSALTGSKFTEEIPSAVRRVANIIQLNINMSEKQEHISGGTV